MPLPEVDAGRYSVCFTGRRYKDTATATATKLNCKARVDVPLPKRFNRGASSSSSHRLHSQPDSHG